jgi:hypothetical protein
MKINLHIVPKAIPINAKKRYMQIFRGAVSRRLFINIHEPKVLKQRAGTSVSVLKLRYIVTGKNKEIMDTESAHSEWSKSIGFVNSM